MKKVIYFLFPFVLIFSFFNFSFALEAGEDFSDFTGGVVTGFSNERFYTSYEKEIFSYNNDDLTDFFDVLEDIGGSAYCSLDVADADGMLSTVSSVCSVDWDIDDIDFSVSGVYKVVGSFVPPTGCSFKEGVRSEIVLNVQILDSTSPVVIVDIASWNPYALAVAVAKGGSQEDIEAIHLFQDYTSKHLRCVDENGSEHIARIDWDFSSVDYDLPGVYSISGLAVAPDGTVFAEDLILPSIEAFVSVQSFGDPDINSFYLSATAIHLPWIAPSCDLDLISAWLCEDDGTWYELVMDDEFGLSNNSVWVSTRLFTNGKTYRVQVDYEGGQTGIFSFLWDDSIVVEGYWEGDRDGGDSNGNVNPDDDTESDDSSNGGNDNSGTGDKPGSIDDVGSKESTVVPKTQMDLIDLIPDLSLIYDLIFPVISGFELDDEGSNSSSPISNDIPLVLEQDATEAVSNKKVSVASSTDTRVSENYFVNESTNSYSRISGVLLGDMIVNDEVVFSKGGIMVTLSSTALDLLSFSDESVFFIEILRLSDESFSCEVFVDDRKVTDLVGTKITLPYESFMDNSVITLRNESNESIATGSYDNEQGIVTFVVDNTGLFTISDEDLGIISTEIMDSSNTSSNVSFSWSFLLFGGLFFVAILCFGDFLWRRHKER